MEILSTLSGIPSRAPAAHLETTGSRALENIDSEKTGRVARERAELIRKRPIENLARAVLYFR